MSALQISQLRGEEIALAVKCFGPPPHTVNRLFTGGEPQQYQRVRREFMTQAIGKGLARIVDYQVWVASLGLAAGAAVPYGVDGDGIVEAVAAIAAPDLNAIVTVPVANALAAVQADYNQQLLDINAAFPGNAAANVQKRQEERLKASAMRRSEVTRINTQLQVQLQNRFDSETDRRRRSEEDLRDLQAEASKLFLRYFQGSAMHAITPYLQGSAFRRALYMLDQLYGLAVANQDAIDILQTQIRAYKFKDSGNFRTQMDDFEMLIEQLVQLGVGLSDSDKKNLLFSAIRNGGIIGRLYESDITLLKSRVMNAIAGAVVPTFANCMDLVNRRYADLSAEASTLSGSNAKRSNDEPKRDYKRGRHTAYLADDAESEEKDKEDPDEPDTALFTAPKGGGSAGAKVVCSKCGRSGHTARDCWTEIKCTKCGKTGHTSAECWSDKTCSICKKKGHVAKVCKNKKKGGGGGPPPKKSGSLTDQVMENIKKMSK